MLIGIAGKARVGKDTAASYLEEFHGFMRFSFAWPIKAALQQWTATDPGLWYGEDKEDRCLPRHLYTPRELMQSLGAWGRAQHPDFWITILAENLSHYRKAISEPGLVVISDVRTEREARWVRQSGGFVMHITRAAAPGVNADETERDLEQVPGDVHIANDGPLADFHREIDRALLEWLSTTSDGFSARSDETPTIRPPN